MEPKILQNEISVGDLQKDIRGFFFFEKTSKLKQVVAFFFPSPDQLRESNPIKTSCCVASFFSSSAIRTTALLG